MDLKNFFKKEYIIGLDIGSSSVKVAQFIAKEDGLHLVRAEMKEVNAAEDDKLNEKEMVLAIRHLLRGIDLKKSHITVSINCSETAIKKVSAPYMPKSELREGIMLEAKNYFHFPVDQAMLDFEVMGDVVEKGIRKYDVMVGVCPINTVNKYLSIVQKAGIKPASFVPSSYALQKFSQILSSKAGGTQCYVDIGQLHTELIICKDGLLVFSRKIPLCGSDFTRAMTGTLVSGKGKVQLSMEEAEKVKREVGMPLDTDARSIDNKISANQILAMLRTPAEHLVNEIDRCFDYYREESGSGRINSVTLFGGGASLSGLIKFLSAGLGMEVRLGDAVEPLKSDKDAIHDREKISHRLELAVGAALSEVKGLNLLPPEIKEEKRRVIKRGMIEVVITAAVIISVLLFIGMKIKINNFNKRISVARMELSALQPELRKAEGIRLAEMVLKDEPYWEDIFKELGSLVPNDITIGSIKMSGQRIFIKGTAASPDGQQILGDFITALERGLFNDVKLVESKNLVDRAGVEFEITCWIDYAS